MNHHSPLSSIKQLVVLTEIVFLPNTLPPVACNGHVCFSLPVRQSLNLLKYNIQKKDYSKYIPILLTTRDVKIFHIIFESL